MNVRNGFLVGALATALALTGCAPTDDGPASPSPFAGAGGGGGGTGVDASSTPVDTEDLGEESSRLPELAEGALCLEGTWLANNEFALASMREFGDEIKSITGTVVLEFKPHRQTITTYNSWTISAEVENIDVRIIRSGVDSGRWDATEDRLTVAEDVVGSIVQMVGKDMNMTVPGSGVYFNDVEYTCTGDTAVIYAPDGTVELTRQ